ncbi:hypothetical protein CERSUDRAFT_100068 [Gelatoporia subvermispora B]|uniref:Uncharacterized protein n=1 Tax=Ceriporiopsis subvermispora (strain B) TaxID=914234 RepID=M2R0R0_CERS8|nr:hypothetical protein CERSUDRAFT_100068 [Gelatoporia subvermispora B]
MWSYPDPDEEIRDHFLSAAWLSGVEQQLFLSTFFCDTLDYIAELIDRANQDAKSYEDLAKFWSDLLDDSRDSIYHEIAQRHKAHWQRVAMQHFSIQTLQDAANIPQKKQDLRSNVRAALRHLLQAVDCSVPESERHRRTGCIKVICSFDEADALALAKVPDNAQEGNLYDVLCTSLDVFRGLPIFFMFLSTNSQIALLAPPRSRMKSIHARSHFSSLVAPFTETAFDCSPVFPLKRTGNLLQDITSVEFMAHFGRPLWHSLLVATKSELEEVQKPPPNPMKEKLRGQTGKSKEARTRIANTADSPGPSALNSVLAAEIVTLARTKLLSCDVLPQIDNLDDVEQFYTPLRKRVLADVRVSLNYEPSREKTYDELADMVASHMRTVYSVPQHREYMRSGYSSEPILAEAAARELNVLRTSGIYGATTLPQIVAQAMEDDLCSVGERGEVVGRTLLTLAYDRAVESESQLSNGPVNYSAGCSLVTFIKELFPENYAQKVLASFPDNAATKQPMSKAFENAHVRFTHFARLGDDGGITPQALLAAFLRGHAQLGHPTQEKIDVVIPVALDKNNICVEKMTVLMISIKRRAMEGSKAEYEICADALGVFLDSFATPLKDHPYIALVMELGVQGRSRYTIGQRHIQRPAAGSVEGGLDGFAKPAGAASKTMTPKSPFRMALGEFGQRRADLRSQDQPLKYHPRYNIYAYGCSPDIYRVINEDERGLYRKLLADRDLFAEHPRKRLPGSIRAMLRQKPILYTSLDSFNWIDLIPETAKAMKLDNLKEDRAYGPDKIFAGEATNICDALTEDHFFGFASDFDEEASKDDRHSGGKTTAGTHRSDQPQHSARLDMPYFERYDTEPEGEDETASESEDYEDVFAAEDLRMGEELAKRREKVSTALQAGQSEANSSSIETSKADTSKAKASTSKAKTGTSKTGTSKTGESRGDKPRGGKTRGGILKAGTSKDVTLSSVKESGVEKQDDGGVEQHLVEKRRKAEQAKSTSERAPSKGNKQR